MRTFVLLLAFMLPVLGACSAASAKAPADDLGKPVCTHFDDATKATTLHVSAVGVAAVATAPVVPPTGAAAVAMSSSVVTGSAGVQAKDGGGTSGSVRPHGAPRWQAFLPGMFK